MSEGIFYVIARKNGAYPYRAVRSRLGIMDAVFAAQRFGVDTGEEVRVVDEASWKKLVTDQHTSRVDEQLMAMLNKNGSQGVSTRAGWDDKFNPHKPLSAKTHEAWRRQREAKVTRRSAFAEGFYRELYAAGASQGLGKYEVDRRLRVFAGWVLLLLVLSVVAVVLL